MKFFLDENFPKAAADMLEEMGHAVFDLRGTGREGSADRDIFAEAQQQGAVFLTTDRDFFHTIPHLHEEHCGVIVIALSQPNRTAILEKLSWVLKRLAPGDFACRTIQLRDRAWIAIPPLDLGG
jgi:predicted nuclease of predicted toxin-antitoxin system